MWRHELRTKAKAEHKSYDEKDLAIKILMHMKRVHGAPCSEEDRIVRCGKCLRDLQNDVRDRVYGPDVTMGPPETGGKTGTPQKPQSQAPQEGSTKTQTDNAQSTTVTKEELE